MSERHQRGLQRQLQLCDTAFRQWIRKPKAGSSVPAGVPVKLYIGAPYAYARLISNVPARMSCSTQVVCLRSSACARGASARERKNSLHLRCEHSLAAVATNCQEWRKRMGRGRDVSGMTLCEIITSPYGCRKPYIRGVYACEITAKGLIGQ